MTGFGSRDVNQKSSDASPSARSRPVLAFANVALLATLASQGSASAGVIVDYVTTQAEGANTRFVYNAHLNSSSRADAAGGPIETFFTIYDFEGFVSASVVAGWEFVLDYPVTAAGIIDSFDSPTIPNLTWRYVGGVELLPGTNLGMFSAVSTFSGTKLSKATGQATLDNTIYPGLPPDDLGPYANGHVKSLVVPHAPEPSGLALIAAGLACMLGGRRRFYARRAVQCLTRCRDTSSN